MHITLITTGKMELLALPSALNRLFPGHTFEAVEDISGRPFSSFTSCRLPLPPSPYPFVVDKIVARAAAMVDPRSSSQTDMVLVLGDLELANMDQPGVVVEVFRDAFRRHLDRYQPNQDLIAAMRSAMAAKVSFHLAVPMIESWIFADPDGPTRAGVRESVKKTIKIRDGDIEQFQVEDPGYLKADEKDCPTWCKKHVRGDRPKWLGEGDRWKHPKGYLQWLMIDGSVQTCTSYREVGGGTSALQEINWGELLRYKKRSTYARALVADIAAALNQAPSTLAWAGDQAAVTRLSESPTDSLLRNI